MKSRNPYKNTLLLVFSIAGYVFVSTLSGGCANSSVAPTGGPKDTIPPVLLSMNPVQRTTGFKGKELSFTFNEYVQLKDQNKNFIISPPLPEKRPELKLSGKSVLVRFPVPPADSTTYYIDFGTSVSDLNEGNPAKSLNFIFSTGPEIDTMIYAGVVVDAFTLEPVDAAIVLLYKENTDSIPDKKNPSAVARTDKDGAYMIKGLKNIDYKVVAILDANNNYRYDPGGERIAFKDSQIKPYWLSAADSIALADLPVLNMFTETAKRQALLDYKRPEERMLQLIFNSINPEIREFDIKGINPNDIIKESNKTGDTVQYWLTARNLPDSINVNAVYLRTDTLNLLSPETKLLKFPPIKKAAAEKQKKGKEEEEEEFTPVVPDIQANTTRIYEYGIPINFKTPLLRVDTSKMKLEVFDDEGKNKTPMPYSLNKDTVNLRGYILNTAWKAGTKYELTILPEAFVDVYSVTNDSIVKSFETANPDKFGVLKLELKGAEKQYIMQVIKDKKLIAQKTAPASGVYIFSNLEAGKYRVRLIEDDNANGEWDTGHYLLHKQPERVVFLKFGEEDTVTMRASWEINQPVDVKSIFENKPVNSPEKSELNSPL